MNEPQAAVNVTPEAAAAPAAPQPSPAELSMAKIRALSPLSNEPDGPEEAEEVTPEPPKPAPGKKVVAAKGDEVEKLRELAKKHGFEVEDGRVLPTERHEFREWKRKQRQAFEGELNKRMSEFTEREKSFSARVEKAESLEKAMEAGDYEGIAKLLGHEDWNKLQESVIARISDPNYKKMRELERWKEDQEKQRVEAEKQQEQQRKSHEKAQEQRRYLQGLSQSMAKSKDPLIAALHDEPLLIQAVYRIQSENFDGQSVPPPEKALRMAAKGAGRSVYDELHGMFLKLQRVFGQQQAAAAPQAAPPAQKKPAPKSAPVPPSASVDASGPGKWGSRPKKDWFEYQRAKLAEAIASEKAGQ